MFRKLLGFLGWTALVPPLWKGCVSAVDWIGRVEIVTRLASLAWIGPVIAFLNSIPPWISFLLLPVGFALLWLRPHRVEPRKSKYISAFDAVKYIWLGSRWGKTHPQMNAFHAFEEFHRVAETGVISCTGLRYGKPPRQEIPRSHWIVAQLEPTPHMTAAPKSIGTISRIEAAATPTYTDVLIRRSDVYRVWPSPRSWYRFVRKLLESP